MESKKAPKFDRTEFVLWLLFVILFLVMAGCTWLVIANRLAEAAKPLG